MADLIDRQALLESLSPNYLEGKKLIENGEVHLDNLAEGYLECSELIRLAPAIEPETGEWFILDECSNQGVYCSACRSKIYDFTHWPKKKQSNFCPNCGIKWREKTR